MPDHQADLDPVDPVHSSGRRCSNFGKQVPMKRPGQPAELELATAFVMLANPLSSYVSGATIAVMGGRRIL